MNNLHQPKLRFNHEIIDTKQYKTKGYPFIISIMAVLQVSTILYSRYFIDIFSMKVSLGPLLFTPAILYIFQIVSEVYGWQYGRQIVWINLIINLLFTVISLIAREIPISSFTHEGLRVAYINLMGTVWLTSLGMGIVIFIADYISSVFTAQSKYYFKGAKIFIRLILVHLITEVLLLSGALLQMPYNGYSMGQTYQSMYDMFMVRLLSSSILGIIAMGVIWVLQAYIEKIICLDVKPDWNLFKISIDESRTILLDINTWNKASKQTRADFIDHYDHGVFKRADL